MWPIAALCVVFVAFTLLYFSRYKVPGEKMEDSWGLKFVGLLVLQFAIAIFIFKYVSQLSGTVKMAPGDAGAQASAEKAPNLFLLWGLIGFFAISLFGALTIDLQAFLKYNDYFGAPGKVRAVMLYSVPAALAALITVQIFHRNPYTNNLMAMLIVVVAMSIAVRLNRVGVGVLCGAIMLLDVYLVWMTSASKGGPAGSGSWYVNMFRSNFFSHFPFPLGFLADGRMLGNGDLLFIALVVVAAKRWQGLKAAIIAGAVTIVPLLLLPYMYLVLKTPPRAWPYTIFIAPIGILIACLPTKNLPKVPVYKLAAQTA